MAVVLDSIERAGDQGDGRDSVVDAFFDTRDRDSILGTYSIDEVGRHHARPPGRLPAGGRRGRSSRRLRLSAASAQQVPQRRLELRMTELEPAVHGAPRDGALPAGGDLAELAAEPEPSGRAPGPASRSGGRSTRPSDLENSLLVTECGAAAL